MQGETLPRRHSGLSLLPQSSGSRGVLRQAKGGVRLPVRGGPSLASENDVIATSNTKRRRNPASHGTTHAGEGLARVTEWSPVESTTSCGYLGARADAAHGV